MNFTNKLDKYLYENNYTKADFSKNSGIPYTTICGWYAKNIKNMQKETIDKLLEYFNCSYEDLFSDNDNSLSYSLSNYEKEVIDLVRKVETKEDKMKLLGKLELIIDNK